MSLERLEVGWGTAAAADARDARNGAEAIRANCQGGWRAARFRGTVTKQPAADPNRTLYPRRPQTALDWGELLRCFRDPRPGYLRGAVSATRTADRYPSFGKILRRRSVARLGSVLRRRRVCLT